jgi:hypothetical protein
LFNKPIANPEIDGESLFFLPPFRAGQKDYLPLAAGLIVAAGTVNYLWLTAN